VTSASPLRPQSGLPGHIVRTVTFTGPSESTAAHLRDELLRSVLERLSCRRDLAAEGGDEHVPRPQGGPGHRQRLLRGQAEVDEQLQPLEHVRRQAEVVDLVADLPHAAVGEGQGEGRDLRVQRMVDGLRPDRRRKRVQLRLGQRVQLLELPLAERDGVHRDLVQDRGQGVAPVDPLLLDGHGPIEDADALHGVEPAGGQRGLEVGDARGGAHAQDGGQARLAEAGVQLHLLARHVEQPAQVHVGHAGAQTAAHHSQVVVVVHRVHRAAGAGQHLDQRPLVGDVQLPHGDTVAARPAGDLFRRGGVGVGDRQLDVPLLGEVAHHRPADEAGASQHYHLQLSVSLRGHAPTTSVG